MAYEALDWPSPPSSTDLVDGGATYNMGILFSLLADSPCPGVQWRVPDSVSTPPSGTHTVSIWSAAGARLAFKDFVPVPGGYQDILFDSALALLGSTDYVAAVYTQHYVFRTSGGVWPQSPSGNIVSAESRLITNADPLTYPASPGTAWFYASPLIDTASDPAQGSAAVTIDLASAATGARSSQGTGSFGLGLAVAASGSAPHGGSAALTLDLSLAASGQRAAGGAAALGLGLVTSATGSRSSRGASALQLNFSVSATGSNGQSGRPVTPWPGTVVPVSSYPWAPRPVRSFQEVDQP